MGFLKIHIKKNFWSSKKGLCVGNQKEHDTCKSIRRHRYSQFYWVGKTDVLEERAWTAARFPKGAEQNLCGSGVEGLFMRKVGRLNIRWSESRWESSSVNLELENCSSGMYELVEGVSRNDDVQFITTNYQITNKSGGKVNNIIFFIR